MSEPNESPQGRSVWLLGSSFEPRGSSLYTLRLASYLPKLGFEPTILCESTAFVPEKLRERFEIFEIPRLTSRFTSSFRVSRLLKDYADRPPVLVHGQRRTLERVSAELAVGFGCPYILTVQELLGPGESLYFLPERLGAIVAISPSVKRALVQKVGLSEELIETIPNGVETSPNLTIPPTRPEQKIPVVGTASALEPVKGLLYFLMAAELILSSGAEVEFLIAGTGPEEEVLRGAVRHLDIANHVTFVGFVQEYSGVLETFDVFVNPALEQGLGTIMLEAMSLGKPVVATQVGGIADFFVNSEHLLLVPPANHVALAEKITYLLDNPTNARNLSALGQQFVRQKFSVEQMALQTVRLYETVLDRGASPSLRKH